MHLYYKLDENKNPVTCSLEEWGNLNFKNDKMIKQEIINGLFISTVFVGIPALTTTNKTILFETMVFDGLREMYRDRYATYDEAMQGHKKAVKWVVDGCK